ncbi:MAG: efflux RND transporter periplasmic adaptor subunit [Planctomycetes bacterium]|nr:efflux RND transporter periplasmic adaptor subunit [Planctomycetota bacterium]
MLRTFIQILLVLAILGGGGGGAFLLYKSKQKPPREEREVVAPLVSVEKVALQDVPVVISGYGTVRAKDMVQVVPQVSGKVVSVADDFVSGGFFPAETTLIAVDPSDYELAVQRAVASVQRAQASVARAQVALELEEAEAQVARAEWQELRPNEKPTSPLVFREPQISQAKAEVAAAQAEVASAETDLATAQLSLERTKISLPFNGRVMEENVNLGQFLVTGQSVATVYGTDVVEIPIPLEDRELAWFDVPWIQNQQKGGNEKAGAAVDVSAEFAGAVHHWPGRVARMQGEVDQNSRMVHIIVEVAEPFKVANGSVPLAPGMFVELKIQGKMLEQVILIPRHAVHNGDEVWVIQEDQLRVQKVEIARRDKDAIYVSSGLEDGDLVVTSPLDVVTDGMKVRKAESGS